MAHSDNDVIRWIFDSDRFKTLSSDEVYEQLEKHAHARSLADWWGPSRTYILDGPKRAAIPDLAHETFQLPILNQRSLTALRELIPSSVQQLRIDCNDYDFWAINVLWTPGALVVERSECDVSVDGNIIDVLDGVFRRDAIDGEIFTVPRCLEVYVTGKFLNAVEEHGLKGLITDLEPMGRLV